MCGGESVRTRVIMGTPQGVLYGSVVQMSLSWRRRDGGGEKMKRGDVMMMRSGSEESGMGSSLSRSSSDVLNNMNVGEFKKAMSNPTLASVCCDVTEMPPSEYMYLVEAWQKLKKARNKHASGSGTKKRETTAGAVGGRLVVAVGAAAGQCCCHLAAPVVAILRRAVPRPVCRIIKACGTCVGLRGGGKVRRHTLLFVVFFV
mgnify:CR=1 FL=1